MDLLKNEKNHFLIKFEKSLDDYLNSAISDTAKKVSVIYESIQYSLKSNGKRFRPFLAYLVFKLKSDDYNLLSSWALAIEFIHTYSLIHDDLPCMDNDDYRRGVLTNHKVFGDDIALLAGDSLISEAIRLVAEDKYLSSEVKLNLIKLLTQKIGPAGMVGGQVLDMKSNKNITFAELKTIHQMKTAALIQTAAVGAAVILNLVPEQLRKVSDFAENLGMAFQIKDDVLDFSTDQQEFKSYSHLLGPNETIRELEKHSQSALDLLSALKPMETTILNQLVQSNLDRTT